MDGGRFVKFVLLLSVFFVETILGAPKCSGRWAIHSCGGGNGKRSEIDLVGDLEKLRSQSERIQPAEYESPDLEQIGRGGRVRADSAYESRDYDAAAAAADEEDLSSYRGRQTNNVRQDSDYDVRREKLLEVLIRRLLKKELAAADDYED